jgi:hypothetical protein
MESQAFASREFAFRLTIVGAPIKVRAVLQISTLDAAGIRNPAGSF